MPGDAESRRRAQRANRAVLLGLVVVFVVPVLIAYTLNIWWPHWSPFGRTNHGDIVEPTWKVELAEMGRDSATAGRWILLHPAATQCDEGCETLLDLTRRVHLSLGKDHDRVVRMFVYREDLRVDHVRAMDAGLVLVPAPGAWFGRRAGGDVVLLLVDPQRHAVLQYGADLRGKGLARDLARVLKISKIG